MGSAAPSLTASRWRGWPTVWNGGPAAPLGPPVLAVEFPVKTVSETNHRSSKAKIGRKAKQRQAVEDALTPEPHADHLAFLYDGGGPWCVRLTRIAPGNGLDRDNLSAALKSVSDAVAAALGVDDGDPAFGVTWAQESRRGDMGVRVEVWGPRSVPR